MEMTQFVLNWGFLYIPKDKSTYIPAFIELLLMVLVCVMVFRFLRKLSTKEAAKAELLEQEMLAKRVNTQQKLEN